VSGRQRSILEKWVRNKADTPYRLVERSRIILLSAAGTSNAEQGRILNVDRQRPRRWRRRWVDAEERLAAAEAEGANDRDLAALVADALNDRKRPGGPPTFSAEQLTMIIAIACEAPEESARPVTHWTPKELADEAIKRGVVKTISPRHVDRLLKGGISGHTRRSTG
jgi:putative transposase